MAKLALLVGVSEYESGLSSLPCAVRDVAAMREVLRHPDMGGFSETDIVVLENPYRLEMEKAIYQLFSSRHRDDLILFFFSGHGWTDEGGKLFFCTREACKSANGELLDYTVVSASVIHDRMERSRSKHQVVILDSCFSGAFTKGLAPKDVAIVDISAELGGEGRAVLASSTSTQYSFEQEGSDLSIYTHYLVEGIKTGQADSNEDGFVSIDELHEYASQNVRAIQPLMRPRIHADQEGYRIRLARVPLNPQDRYGKEVKQFVPRGTVSFLGRKRLEVLRSQLGLTIEDAAAIENEILGSHQPKFQAKLKHYEQVYGEAIRRETVLSERTHRELHNLRQLLDLEPEDVAPVETQIVEAYQTNLKQYEQSFRDAIQQLYPFTVEQQQQLKRQQQQLALSDEDIFSTELRLLADWEEQQRIYRELDAKTTSAVEQPFESQELAQSLGNNAILPSVNVDSIVQNELPGSSVLPQLDTIQPLLNNSITSDANPEATRASALKAAIASLRTVLGTYQQTLQKVGGSLLAASTISGVSFLNQHAEQTDRATLAQIATLNSRQQYDQCISQAQTLSSSFRFWKDVQGHLNGCRLNKAKELAGKSNFQDAIALAAQVPADITLYGSLAQNAIETWSNNLIQQATKQYQAGKKDEAIAELKAELKIIPTNSTAGKKAQEAINQWNKEWANNVATLAKANQALTDKKWTLASDTAKKTTTAYWKQKAQPIIQRAENELASINSAPAPSSVAVVNLDSGNSSNSPSSGGPPSVSSDSSNKTSAVRAEPPPADSSTIGGDQ